MGRLDNKVAIITGGAGEIGQAAGALFAKEGARVLLADLNEEKLQEAVAAIGGNSVSYCVTDVTKAEDNQAMVACAEERYGGVDVFLANAGVEGLVKPIPDYTEADFDHVMNVNVKGVFLGLQATVPALKKRGAGSIVITSSVAGVEGYGHVLPYVTSKHAVVGMMRSAAKECAADKIRVNTVNPSPVDGRMISSLNEGMSDMVGVNAADLTAASKAAIPLQRYARPDEIAQVMLFLASDDASWVTGSVYMADGGNTT